ncbi:hypothetical protein B0H34DRAFT_446595 [Crassisporium funariophilum]|nr:hypothetical protein B0H34DRAFT_446595 [Crassisporium funariophilum]
MGWGTCALVPVFPSSPSSPSACSVRTPYLPTSHYHPSDPGLDLFDAVQPIVTDINYISYHLRTTAGVYFIYIKCVNIYCLHLHWFFMQTQYIARGYQRTQWFGYRQVWVPIPAPIVPLLFISLDSAVVVLRRCDLGNDVVYY